MIDNFVFDTFARYFPRPYTDLPVRILDIDDASLAKYGQWPWPRQKLAVLTQRLTDAGASAIVFDVLFSEPDRTSPVVLASGLADEALKEKLALLPESDHDKVFAAALGASPAVLPIGLLPGKTATVLRRHSPVAVIGADVLTALPHYAGAISTLPILQDAAPGLATFSFVAQDQVIRAVPLISVYQGEAIPGLSLEAMRIASGGGTIALRQRSVDGAPRLAIKVGHSIIDAEADGALRLHFAGRIPARTLSAMTLLDPAPDPAVLAQFKGSIVLIGTSAAGLADLKTTPVNSVIPGVEIHAEAIEHMMLGISLRRPDWIVAGETVAIVAFAGVATVLAGAFGGGVALAAVMAGSAGSLALAAFAFVRFNLLVDPALPVMTGLANGIVVAFVRHALIDRNRRQLKLAFAQYLAPSLVDQLARNPELVKLGGETRQISCLFTDLADFTRFSEAVSAQTLVTVMNAYLSEMCRIAKDHGGTVLKLIGDSVHVIFNAPLDQPDHANRAITCALAMSQFGHRFMVDQNRHGIAIGRTRIGIATGPAVVGNFGGEARFDYTAYGDTVNTAARLEAANKPLGTSILMTEATAQGVSSLPDATVLRPVARLRIRGKTETVEVFETVDPEQAGIDCARYLRAILALAGNEPGGLALMAEYVAAFPDDPVARLMLSRLSAGEDPLLIAV